MFLNLTTVSLFPTTGPASADCTSIGLWRGSFIWIVIQGPQITLKNLIVIHYFTTSFGQWPISVDKRFPQGSWVVGWHFSSDFANQCSCLGKCICRFINSPDEMVVPNASTIGDGAKDTLERQPILLKWFHIDMPVIVIGGWKVTRIYKFCNKFDIEL